MVPVDGSRAPYTVDDPAGHGVGSFVVAPTGDRVAYTDDQTDQLFTVRLDGSERAAVSTFPVFNRQFAWDPSATHLVYRDDPPTLAPTALAITCADHDCTRRFLTSQETVAFAISPDGEHVASTTGSPTVVWITDVDTGEQRHADGFAVNGYPLWSPDSTRVAYAEPVAANGTSRLKVACATTSCTLTMPVPATNQLGVERATWSSDSRFLAIESKAAPANEFQLYVMCADGSCVKVFDPSGDISGPHHVWTPDGRLLHRGRMPGSTVTELVVDCPRGDCARESASAGIAASEGAFFAPGSPRFAFHSGGTLFVVDHVGAPPRHLADFTGEARFDRSGEAVIFHSTGAIKLIRVDGTGERALDLQVTPAVRLSPSNLFPI